MGLLEFGAPLVDRLRAQCPSANHVIMAEDLAGVLASSQPQNSLYVLLLDYFPAADDGADSSLWHEVWGVVASVKHVAQGIQAGAARLPAVPMLREVLAAVDGWHAPGIVGRARAVRPPPPLIIDGFGYFPLAFEITTVTDGCDDPAY